MNRTQEDKRFDVRLLHIKIFQKSEFECLRHIQELEFGFMIIYNQIFIDTVWMQLNRGQELMAVEKWVSMSALSTLTQLRTRIGWNFIWNLKQYFHWNTHQNLELSNTFFLVNENGIILVRTYKAFAFNIGYCLFHFRCNKELANIRIHIGTQT